MDFSQLIQWNFYFSHTGLNEFPSLYIALSWGGALIVLGIIWMLIRKYIVKDSAIKKVTKKFGGRLIWFGIFGLFLAWVRIESIPFLSLRFWWVVYIIIFIVVLYFVIRNCKRNYHVKVITHTKAKTSNDKYIPSPKKKKKKKKR